MVSGSKKIVLVFELQILIINHWSGKAGCILKKKKKYGFEPLTFGMLISKL